MKFKLYLILYFLMGLFGAFSQQLKNKTECLKGFNYVDINKDGFVEFLDSNIINYDVIFLGESSHGCEEFSYIKKNIIADLFRKGFKTVIFESGMAECYGANAEKSKLNEKDFLASSIFSVWNTNTNVELMGLIKDLDLNISGFDFQFSGKNNSLYVNKLDSSLLRFKRKLIYLDSTFLDLIRKSNYYLDTNNYELNNKYINLKKEAIPIYNELLTHLSEKNDKNNDMTSRIIKNKLFYISNFGNYKKLYLLRDSVMSDNLNWLINNYFQGQKIIVWGHNSHIAKEKSLINENCYMGSVLDKEILKRSFTIGLFAYSGEMWSGNKVTKVLHPSKSALESKLYRENFDFTFYNLKTSHESWVNKKIKSFYWGSVEEKIIPTKYYDGIILIKKSSIPTYSK